MYYYFEGFSSRWAILTETLTSQKLQTITPDGYEFLVDIHFAPEKVLTVNIVVVSENENEESSRIHETLFDEVCQIAMMRYDFDVINYTMASTKKLYNGNYKVEDILKSYCLMVRNSPEFQTKDDDVLPMSWLKYPL
jgi:hypothetical protein